MANAHLIKEIRIETEDRPGMLEEISSALSDSKINIKHIAAYAQEGKAHFMIVSEDNEKAYQALRSKGYVAIEKEVVLLGLADTVGMLKQVAEKIKAAGISLNYLYGTTCADGCESQLIMSSNDNKKLLSVLA
ncbi:MAG: ACT domain-containing protein [Candidatus Omnitrophota bacterium]|nr:ACT domain-containing protein [Candidatus Omnitrophota bacterium]